MDGRGCPTEGPGPCPTWPTPSAVPCRLHHDSRWCWAGGARWLETWRDRQTDGASTNDAPWPPHHTPAPARSVQGRGDREGRRGGRGGRGGGHQERLIPFFVLCRLWRGFLGLAVRAGLLGGPGGRGCGGLLPGGGGGRGRGGGWREGPCCCWGLATHAKLVHPRGVDAVDPPLVEVDEEDHIWGWGEGAA